MEELTRVAAERAEFVAHRDDCVAYRKITESRFDRIASSSPLSRHRIHQNYDVQSAPPRLEDRCAGGGSAYCPVTFDGSAWRAP